MARKKIKKVSVAPINPITGSIINSKNITNKQENTYSAEIIDGLFSNWEKVEFESSSNYVDNAHSFIYVNKLLKLVYVQIGTNQSLPTGATQLAVVPSPYRPNIQPEDTCWFNMWSAVGSGNYPANFGRGSIYGSTGQLKVLSANGNLPSVIGTTIYPYAD